MWHSAARAMLILGVWAIGLAGSVATWGASPMESLAKEIGNRVDESVWATLSPPSKACSVLDFEPAATAASWTEVWPDGRGGETTRAVRAKVWDAPIRAALAKHGAVFFPNRDLPYYISDPIVLRSGQRLQADSRSEIRLVPNTNTCMVRNEHLVSGQDRPIPANAVPDTQIVVEGGIWTTLATSPTQSNGNSQGWPVRQDRSLNCHGVILLSNVRKAVVRNLVIRQSRAHAVQISNASDFLVENVTFEEHRRDGIHINGPARYGIIRGIRGVTGDDFIALNAWDWSNTVPCFGSIDHILVDGVYGDPRFSGTDEIRLLPGTKTFGNGGKLDCPVADCVLRNLHEIRTFKIYDQPNLEMGRDRDFSDPIGTIRNVYFDTLVFNRPGRFQIAANVEGLVVNNVELKFDSPSAKDGKFKLIEIGPMSETYKIKPDDPATWVELFSPDRDMSVRAFRLSNVRVRTAHRWEPLPNAEADLVTIANQKPNPDYPKSTPRGGRGKVMVVR